MASTAITAQQAAIVLGNLRQTRDNVSTRAAGLSLMIWAMVIASTAGTLVILNFIVLREDSNWGTATWGLFLAANIASVALWVALGAHLQNSLWQAFGVPRPANTSAWKSPLTAFGAAFVLVALNLPLQGLMATLNGLNESSTMEQIHWNLGFAFALSISGAIVVAVALLLSARGFPPRLGIITGVCMILFGHFTTFLWFPDLGTVGPLIAVAAVPAAFLALGSRLFRQG